MSKFIVMDVVFYANSLNYDQGSGNYQELKKITKWDGKQYTIVSRYALKYSLLETGKRLGLWQIAEGKELMPEENQKVIQPAESLLLSGKILIYPEFDLFGYLLTSVQPQNFRKAPVKLDHAISLTPFNYDALFNANIGLANRIRKAYGEMNPNPFTSEEHFTFYQYSVIIDVDKVGSVEIYLSKEYKKGKTKKLLDKFKVTNDNANLRFEIGYRNLKTWKFTVTNTEKVKLEKVYLPLTENDKSISVPNNEVIKNLIEYDENLGVIIFKYKFSDIQDRIQNLIRCILNLHRSIKGRDEDLSPKLLVMGIYKDGAYRTYKDNISLVDEHTEEEYDQIEEKTEDGKKVVKVKHITSKSKKPVFRIRGISGKCEKINEAEIFGMVDTLFNGSSVRTPESGSSRSDEAGSSHQNSKKQENNCSDVKVFCAPGIEVRLDSDSAQPS